jgi:hypothetical protein
MMDHDSIIKDNTAERYLLRELTEAEQEAFEEHYFECPECAERVHCGTELMQYGRDVAISDLHRETRPVPPVTVPQPAKHWMQALQVGVLAVLTLGVGIALYQYQRTGVSAPVQQAALQDRVVHLDGSRGSAGDPFVLGNNERPVLSFAIPSWGLSPDAMSYRAVLALPSGRSLSHEITVQQADDQIDWTIERKELASGSYSMTIRSIGKDGAELKTNQPAFSFMLKLQNN